MLRFQAHSPPDFLQSVWRLKQVILSYLQHLPEAHVIVRLPTEVGVVVEAAVDVSPGVSLGIFEYTISEALLTGLLVSCVCSGVSLEGWDCERTYGPLLLLVVECCQVTDDVLQVSAISRPGYWKSLL